MISYPGEDGFWVAECPILPGCISQEKTKEEAIKGYIATLEENGLPVPKERLDTLQAAVRTSCHLTVGNGSDSITAKIAFE